MQFETTTLGLTNQTCILHRDTDNLYIRLPKKRQSLGLAPQHEKELLPIVKDLDVPTLFFDQTTGIKITKEVKAVPFGQSGAYDKIQRTAALISKLHALPVCAFSFDPFSMLAHYKSQINLAPLPCQDAMVSAVSSMWTSDTLCHNDLVAGNILLGETDYLIDYEYAGMGDARFDLASFLSENQIEGAERALFLSCFPEYEPSQICLFELFADILWMHWAALFDTPLHRMIMQDKRQHYLLHLEKIF